MLLERRSIPHDLRAEQPRANSEDEAAARAEADFIETLDKECLVATDGAGGAVGARSERHRSVGAGQQWSDSEPEVDTVGIYFENQCG